MLKSGQAEKEAEFCTTFPPKADIGALPPNVRNVPKSRHSVYLVEPYINDSIRR
jgi:hypothetical protein